MYICMYKNNKEKKRVQCVFLKLACFDASRNEIFEVKDVW